MKTIAKFTFNGDLLEQQEITLLDALIHQYSEGQLKLKYINTIQGRFYELDLVNKDRFNKYLGNVYLSEFPNLTTLVINKLTF